MGTADHGQDESEPQVQSLTPKEAGRRVAALRRVYDEGYISSGTLKAITRNIRARVKRSSGVDRDGDARERR
jgi:hypothetical protein